MSLLLIISLIFFTSCNSNGTPKRKTIIFREEWLIPENVTISLSSTLNVGYEEFTPLKAPPANQLPLHQEISLIMYGGTLNDTEYSFYSGVKPLNTAYDVKER